MRIFILKWQFSFAYISWGKKYVIWFYSAPLYIVSVLFSIDFQIYFIYTSCSIPACLESVSCMECSYESMPLSVMEQPKPNLQLVLKIWPDKNKCKPVRKLTYLLWQMMSMSKFVFLLLRYHCNILWTKITQNHATRLLKQALLGHTCTYEFITKGCLY